MRRVAHNRLTVKRRRVAYHPAALNTAPGTVFFTMGRRRIGYPAVMNTAPGGVFLSAG